ncbi:Predicted dehydrogenase [Palleronia marisminoris]|uniref:Putative oxidoreductase n=1 Tax=Palleronia marisminoris TaxID=315423 RepID=A0A1Y5T094_9RHOB|nr:Gfo/Idh/MocA family oxidoreductase [Palleronia marisminoris]SFH09109.1 Predicted dehydrogenase [Palleronia marisminoris]SLN52437.1 putative oxidoreductase [Palleronia marisminoris]
MTSFAAIGLDHNHIYGQVAELLAAGGRLDGFATEDEAQAKTFLDAHPDAPRRSEADLLADPEIALITSAAVPSDRAALARRAMQAGKDVLLDKPGVITRDGLAALRAAHAETGRRVRVHHSELESNAAAQTALRLVRDGAIGRVIHYFGTGPHRMGNPDSRPDWFWDRDRNGGILADIGAHHIAQFLAFTGETRVRITSARTACQGAAKGFQDMGDMVMEAGDAQGYARVDWYTPAGMPTWGDGRIILTGTDGVLELRKYVDPAGEGVGPHVILTDADGPRRIPCEDQSDFCARVLADARDGTETAIPQDTAFHIMEAGLIAQELGEVKTG